MNQDVEQKLVEQISTAAGVIQTATASLFAMRPEHEELVRQVIAARADLRALNSEYLEIARARDAAQQELAAIKAELATLRARFGSAT